MRAHGLLTSALTAAVLLVFQSLERCLVVCVPRSQEVDTTEAAAAEGPARFFRRPRFRRAAAAAAAAASSIARLQHDNVGGTGERLPPDALLRAVSSPAPCFACRWSLFCKYFLAQLSAVTAWTGLWVRPSIPPTSCRPRNTDVAGRTAPAVSPLNSMPFLRPPACLRASGSPGPVCAPCSRGVVRFPHSRAGQAGVWACGAVRDDQGGCRRSRDHGAQCQSPCSSRMHVSALRRGPFCMQRLC